MTPIDNLKQISIKEYLERQGYTFTGRRPLFCKSPFSTDSTWSLAYYEATNSFYDWSVGFGGSIIDLVVAMEGTTISGACKILEDSKSLHRVTIDATPVKSKPFEYTQYLTQDPDEVRQITQYARSRKLINGYEACRYPVFHNNKWITVPAIGFLHRDYEGAIVGIKLRSIKDEHGRFSARGKMMFYILEYIDLENFGPPTLYVVEGESNANSLWQYCKEIRKNCIVISFGSVSTLPPTLPNKFNIKDKKLIIDFDGNEELFNQRVALYDKYNLTPIKLFLKKGEDINSLYISDELNLINKLL